MLSAFRGRAVSGLWGLVGYFLGSSWLLFGEIFEFSWLLFHCIYVAILIKSLMKGDDSMKKRTGKGKNDRRELAVYQANPLIQARKHYGIIEHRLFRLAIADLRPKLKNSMYYDEEFRPFHMTAKELLDQFQGEEGGERHSLYERIFEAHKNMMGSYVQIGTAKDHTLFPVFDMIKFNVKEGLSIQFHRSMKKFLLDLEHGGYTKSLLRLAFSLSSTYALILLELMLQYQGRQKNGRIERDLDMEELRFSMDVPENAYDGRMNNFRKRVVDAAIREINEKTDYRMEPKYGLLRGKYNRVTGFHFVLHLPEAKEQEKEPPAPADGMEERLKKYGIHWSTARRLSKMPNVEGCLQIALENIQKGKAKNPAAYIRAAIEQDWQSQREAVKRAMEEEERERKDKKKWDLEATRRAFMVEDSKRQEERRQSLEEIAKGESPFSGLARKILSRRKEAANDGQEQEHTETEGAGAEKATPKKGTAGAGKAGKKVSGSGRGGASKE